MRGLSWLVEVACTAMAIALFCTLLCGGLIVLTGLIWFLRVLGADVLVMPIFGAGMLANLVLSFLYAGKIARWMFPRTAA